MGGRGGSRRRSSRGASLCTRWACLCRIRQIPPCLRRGRGLSASSRTPIQRPDPSPDPLCFASLVSHTSIVHLMRDEREPTGVAGFASARLRAARNAKRTAPLHLARPPEDAPPNTPPHMLATKCCRECWMQMICLLLLRAESEGEHIDAVFVCSLHPRHGYACNRCDARRRSGFRSSIFELTDTHCIGEPNMLRRICSEYAPNMRVFTPIATLRHDVIPPAPDMLRICSEYTCVQGPVFTPIATPRHRVIPPAPAESAPNMLRICASSPPLPR